MANIVGLNDGNLLSADNVYDSNQATDQQTINANQQTINNATLNVAKHIIPCVSMSTGQTSLTVKVKSNGSRGLLIVIGISSTGNGTVVALCTSASGTRNLGYITTANCTFSNWTWTVKGLLAGDMYIVLCTHEIESWSVS